MCLQFNENHALKRLGLTYLEDHEELKKMIKPTHREFLYKLLDINNQGKETGTEVSNSADDNSKISNERSH